MKDSIMRVNTLGLGWMLILALTASALAVEPVATQPGDTAIPALSDTSEWY